MGLDFFDIGKRSFINYQPDPDDVSSLSTNTVRSILADKRGILWVSTFSGGINKHDINLPDFKLFRKHGFDEKRLRGNIVSSFAQADDGNVRVGTDGAGLHLLNLKTNACKN